MKKNIINSFHVFILLIVSFFSNYYFGSIGVFPIDTFAFFDSANFINKGFLPIRDFWTSNGLLVDVIQSFFFKLFGVSWMVYLLQSSILNFLFAFFTYKFLKNEGMSAIGSLFYSISTAILAYPSAGAPFPDHHSLLLSLIGVYIFIYALKYDKIYLWASIPLFLILAFLCKQVPAAFFIILLSLYLLFYTIINKKFLTLIQVISSSVILLLGCLFLLNYNQIEIKDFLLQYIFFPLTIGEFRSSNFNLGSLLILIKDFKFLSFISILLIYEIANEIRFSKNKIRKLFDSNIIILCFVIIAMVNQIISKNQNIIFFLLPILIGMTHIKVNKKYKSKIVFIYMLILLNIFITIKYHYRFNIERKFIELENISKTNQIDSEVISRKLKGLKWISMENKINLNDKEISLLQDTIKYLKENQKNSLIITHYQFIRSEIDHKIYSPNRWYTSDGVSYPLKKNKYYKPYINFYKKKLIEYKVNKIYTVGAVDQSSFNFIFKQANCVKSVKINKILDKHEISDCFK